MNEFLPTRAELCRRHVKPVSFCEVCGDPEESTKHILLDCSVAKLFWEQTKLTTGVKMSYLNAATWVVDLMSELCPRRDQAIIVCGMWALWNMRNSRRHGELLVPIHQAVSWARDTTYDLWRLGQRPEQQKQRCEAPRWKRPAMGSLEINTDAAFFERCNQGATAIIFRDHQGAFIVAQAIWRRGI